MWANERLSAVEADALASAIRPSWEVDAGGWSSVDEPPTNDASAQAVPQVTTGPSIVVDDEVFREVPVAPVSFDQDEDPILPVSRSPGKMLAIFGGIAVVGVLVVVGSFMGGGETETPTPQSAVGTTTPTPQAAAAGTTEVAGATAEPQPEANAQDLQPQTPEPEANAQDPQPQTPEPEANAQDPQPQTPEPQPEAAPPQVQVSLRATPSGAQLTLDGERIPNPYQAELPVDGRQHQVVATLEGYRETTRTLGFDRDRNETLTLSAIPAPTPPPSMTATMSSRSASRMSSSMAHGTGRHRPSGMHGRGMRGRGMRGSRHSAGFTSANPY
ncbi:MAG: hypothetical protein GXP55_21215 [Deltaproteobacteria bacterium]|nr:hypothetical protein [Deltaproteobacteria bacterium]